ncbi:hypothetical protein AND_006609 [Anopheles darlingi]|uniref:Uncharacterized protein n=1 Tax=Anopheles darlingi TaxID=43151 RepID=W5JFX9_ANODA|nr:hypothetical protein AND_006609 [Anopheles darlingi]
MASFRNAHKSLSVEERAEMKEKFEELASRVVRLRSREAPILIEEHVYLSYGPSGGGGGIGISFLSDLPPSISPVPRASSSQEAARGPTRLAIAPALPDHSGLSDFSSPTRQIYSYSAHKMPHYSHPRGYPSWAKRVIQIDDRFERANVD